MDEQLKSNLTSSAHWKRLVFMILFALFLYVASFVMAVVVVVQFIFSLVTGNDNHKLRRFGYSLSAFINQTLLFLTYNSEYKPFPFSDWPEAPIIPAVETETSAAEPFEEDVVAAEEPEVEPDHSAMTPGSAQTESVISPDSDTPVVEPDVTESDVEKNDDETPKSV